MLREYSVLSALDGTAVPVPRTLYFGGADGPLDAPFYVMERVVGHICRNALPAGYAESPSSAARSERRCVDTLAALHTVDPAAVGLAEFGRPAGFMERQLRRWSKQWEATKVAELPALDALLDDLAVGCRSSESTRSCTATTGSTTRSCTRRSRAGSSPCSTGR